MAQLLNGVILKILVKKNIRYYLFLNLCALRPPFLSMHQHITELANYLIEQLSHFHIILLAH
jgi:hypothetical protein